MKRNVKAVMEKMKKLQRQLKEYERLYYVEIGKATEQWLLSGGDVAELKQRIEQIKQQFGKE